MPKGAPMVPLGATLFGQLSLSACAEWLWSGYAVKHPALKIIMSEGGIGWVAMLHDRLENIVDRSGYGHYFPGDLRPAEILHRNFWFSTIDDPSTLSTRGVVGIDHITFESDYPHGDGTWPDTQTVFADVFGSLPADEIAKISHENAAQLFHHPLPPPGSPHAIGVRR
jgi:predicted TIM-barrel fold metal-dependent hydrolase